MQMRKGCLFIEILVCLKEINLKRCVRYFLPQNLQNCHNSWRYAAYRSFSVSFTLIFFMRYFCIWIATKPNTLRENIKNTFNFGFTVYLQSIVLLLDTRSSIWHDGTLDLGSAKFHMPSDTDLFISVPTVCRRFYNIYTGCERRNDQHDTRVER